MDRESDRRLDLMKLRRLVVLDGITLGEQIL